MRRLTTVFFSVILAALTWALLSSSVRADAQPAYPKVSFTFDDGYSSTLLEAAPVLSEFGYTGTAYITTSFVGQSEYLTWSQTSQLASQYGWEIGAHSVTHPLMSQLSDLEIENEVATSKSILESKGFNPKSFATPYGDYDNRVIEAIARHYTSHRPFHDTGYNTWPYNDYLIKVQQVQVGVSVSQVKQYIDQAKTNNYWLVLVFHNIADNPSPDSNDYEYSTEDLRQIASYVKTQGLDVVNVSDGLIKDTVNMVNNSSFTNGLSGWTTDNPNLAIDQNNNGSVPESQSSAKIVSTPEKNVHLFSEKINVSDQKQYVLKSYVNLDNTQITSEAAWYIDEYDQNGNWISGQYKPISFVDNVLAKNANYVYVPTSVNVASISLQFILTASSSNVLLLDNVQLYCVGPKGPGDPNPEPQNLLVNGNFEQGLSNGWSTDASQKILLDVNNNGAPSEPKNSIKLTSRKDRNVHLFSPKVNVSPAQTYKISAFLNVARLRNNSSIGFYVDEYDVNGQWISGKYIGSSVGKGIKNVEFSYTPSSTQVTSAKLQIIVVKGSNTLAYIDDICWQPI
ncbi:hypothetical protein DYH10_02860 [Candidatus Saccharibacteria bacterium CPR2]|nr:hypothetical protein [Candidatus Saccharibacteria bacterium CPR2]